ncbi:AsmA family protein [Thermodesulfobacteriota bacterium]
MRWKWILGAAALLFLSVIVAVFVILSRYDFNDLKPQITRAAKEATGRELTLSGDIDLKIGLTPKLLVENVSFQNAPWGSRPEMAKVRRVEVQVALLPLIHKNIEIKRLVLVEPDIIIETDKNGRTNLEFKTQEKDAAPEPKKKEAKPGKIELPPLIFEDLQIEKGQLTYKDARKNKSLAVKIESLKTRATGPESPITLDLKGDFNGTPFEVASTLGALAKLADPDKDWPLKLSAKAVDTTLTLEGTIKDISGLRGFQVEFSLASKNLADLEQFIGKPIPIKGAFDISARLLDSAPNTYKISNLKANAADTNLFLDGTIQNPTGNRTFDLQFSLDGQDLAHLEQFTGKPFPVKGPFSISANLLGPKPDIYKISDLKAKIGDNNIDGSLEANLSGKVPYLSASLSSQNLDLRPLFPEQDAKKEEVADKPKPKRDKVFSGDPLPIELLTSVNAEARLRIGRLLAPKLAVNDLVADMTLQNGYLKLKPLKAIIGGGTLNGFVDLKPKQKTANMILALKIDQLDVGKMLQDLNITDLLYGKIDADINVRSYGESVAALMARLNGNTRITMKSGRINNKHINLLGGDLSSGVYRMVNPVKEKTDYTEINCLVSLFDIKDGVADSTALVLSTDSMNVIGDGKIDLKTEKLDISLKPVPKEGVAGVSFSLGELTKPFKLGGTLANPGLAIDTTQAAIAIGKAVGGVALFGPIGIAAALAGSKSDDENPCLTAIESAQKGVKTSEDQPAEEKGTVQKTVDGAKEGIKGFGKKIKGLFGD